MKKTERTMIMLKPEAFRRNLVDKILAKFKEAGLKIVKYKKIGKPSRDLMGLHYPSEGFIKIEKMKARGWVIDYCLFGPIAVAILEGENAIQRTREIIGDRDPKLSKKGTIRSWVNDSMEEADARGEALPDLIHGPRTKEEAELQIGLWFEREGQT